MRLPTTRRLPSSMLEETTVNLASTPGRFSNNLKTCILRTRVFKLLLKFSSRALRETGEAHKWYESKCAGRGEEFLAAFELQLNRLEQTPVLSAEVIVGVRQALPPRFPYSVFYAIRNDLVHVLALRWMPGLFPEGVG
jgi:toxin ParE1/3/4